LLSVSAAVIYGAGKAAMCQYVRNPGDHIPAIPAHPFKTGAEFTIADAWKFGDDVNVVGSRNLVHDDANQNRKVPAHAESCKRDHASPPLGKLADINVVFLHEVELATSLARPERLPR
jgi:hypothetical protein